MPEPANDPPFFTKVAAVPFTASLYERPAGAAGPGWTAFATFTIGSTPDALTFAQSWSDYLGKPLAGQNGGVYIVAAERPSDPGGYLGRLLTAVRALNVKAGGFGYRYLFFGDPTSKDPSALPGTIPFATGSRDPNDPGKVHGWNNGESRITTRGIGLAVADSAYLYCDVETSSLRLAPNGSAGITLLANKYAPKTISSLDSPVSVPLDGPTGGTLRFGLKLTVSDDPQHDDFTLLDVGLKYFTERDGRVISQRYPVFGPPVGGAPVPFDVSYDPLRPLDHGRTAFAFRAPGDGDCAPMASGLRDDFAHPVRLVPQAGESRLVVQDDMITVDSPNQRQHASYYLTPSGPFTLAAGDSKPPAARVMCGLSPLESVVFDPPGSRLAFHPDADAYSPLLADTVQDGHPPRLSDRFRTSWATITARAAQPLTTAPVYLSQPQGSAMFGHGDKTGVPYLEHRETPAAVLRDAAASGSFPMAPYGQVVFDAHPDTFSADDVAALERDVLAVERRARISAASHKPTPATLAETAFAVDATGADDATGDATGDAAQPMRVTTPQGFIADLASDGSGDWKRLHLAQTSWSPSPEESPTVTTLAFDDVDDTLRAAFQTNQQFLVVTKPKAPWNPSKAAGTSTTVFEDQLRPQGWPFDIRTGTRSDPGDYRNVLLFKFCDGSIEQRIGDIAKWTAAKDFNADPADVAEWLAAYIDQAKQLAQGPDGAYFAKFVDAVTSESWRGILALRVDVDASALPQELRGLAAGIDLDDFNAHHVGIDLGFVDTADGQLRADGNSSLFATVYYLDPTYAAGLDAGAPQDLPTPVVGGGDYAFRVLSLKTLFANAEITAFASKSQITLDRLFGDQIGGLTLNGVEAPSNSLVLDGTYENHDGVGVYIFGTDADARFLPVSNLWRGIETVRASFSTLRADDAEVVSRFSFQGFLDFASVSADDGTTRTPLDVLSFGGDAEGTDPAGSGLPFAELHLDMSFNTASPGTPSFAFRVDQMTFAPTVAQARGDSLYARMPLTLTGITASTAKPGDLGYLPVNALSLPTDPLGGQWYALVYTLDLGTPGALAASAGFAARLMVAWGPQSQGNGYRLWIGLSLPGVSGTSRGFSLQGVLKLTIGRTLLYRDPKSKTFVLRLTNVLLSLLGISLPTGTSTAFIVFGNPDPGKRDVVGWYAAVNREPKREQQQPSSITGGA
ncbi:hypothetical protein [Glycomyces arizonensis]|uniref:hypothetical protein n=1 Tax=Glycomyces arizonensis TaxID=256035 RepID=UPI000400431F|nr:hypothetical protein [Glycomyces arizonensis]